MEKEIEKIEKSLSEHRDLLTDDECDKMDTFMLHCNLDSAQDFHVIQMNDEFTEGEAFVLYPDYMTIRCKSVSKNKKHCETMAMDVDHETVSDICSNVIRDSITAISMFRETSCDCDDCLAKIAKGEKEKQSNAYIIQICTPSRPHILFGGDKDNATWLQEHLLEWRLKKGVFKYKKGVYHKNIK